MEKKFILPASTFLGGIVLWLTLFFVIDLKENDFWPKFLFGIITGGLIVVSAFSCRRSNGPKFGNLFRSGILLVMAALTFWKIGITAAIVLAIASIITMTIALTAKKIEPKIN
jgi:hypothetical protein